jgi:hypothetical protein
MKDDTLLWYHAEAVISKDGRERIKTSNCAYAFFINNSLSTNPYLYVTKKTNPYLYSF